jgi:hypothetical protein
MRRTRTALGLVALAGITASVGLAAPAHAATVRPDSGYVLYKSYGWPDACSSAGYAGEQAGQWVSYYCDTIDPASWDAPGLYDLYVEY